MEAGSLQRPSELRAGLRKREREWIGKEEKGTRVTEKEGDGREEARKRYGSAKRAR